MITYHPSKILRKLAPTKKIQKLMTGKFTLNRAVLSMFDSADFIKKGKIAETALKTIKQYKKTYNDGEETKAQVVGDKALLINRVQNAVVFQIAQDIKETYSGEYYKWLPSSAATPDPEHQLNYGKTFQIGDGEMPGERYGCQCGMQILVPGDTLEL